MQADTILVTGGAGFIGSNFVLRWIENVGTPVVNLDQLTYAGNPANLARSGELTRATSLLRGDICDAEAVAAVLRRTSSAGDRPLRRREPRRPLDPRSRRVHPHQRHGTFKLLEQARALLVVRCR